MEGSRVPQQRFFGFTRRGPHFYVWDEDAREADHWAAELAQASRSVQPVDLSEPLADVAPPSTPR
jgi:hypothetical protein